MTKKCIFWKTVVYSLNSFWIDSFVLAKTNFSFNEPLDRSVKIVFVKDRYSIAAMWKRFLNVILELYGPVETHNKNG